MPMVQVKVAGAFSGKAVCCLDCDANMSLNKLYEAVAKHLGVSTDRIKLVLDGEIKAKGKTKLNSLLDKDFEGLSLLVVETTPSKSDDDSDSYPGLVDSTSESDADPNPKIVVSSICFV